MLDVMDGREQVGVPANQDYHVNRSQVGDICYVQAHLKVYALLHVVHAARSIAASQAAQSDCKAGAPLKSLEEALMVGYSLPLIRCRRRALEG